MKNLYKWIFHFNHYRDKWFGIHVDDWTAYKNNTESRDSPIFTSKNMESVINQIQRYEEIRQKRADSKGSTRSVDQS